MAQYLAECRKRYRDVEWFTHVHEEHVPYVSRVAGVAFTSVGLGGGRWLRPAEWHRLLGSIRQIDSETIVLMWLPHPVFAMAAPLVKRRSALLAVYVGNDWVGESAYRRTAGRQGWFAHVQTRARAALEQMVMARALRLADLVLVRGARVAAHARRHNDRVIESLPLLAAAPPRRRPPVGEPLDGPVRLLYVGKLNPGKGVDVLLDAFGRALAGAPDGWTLSIAGSGPMRADLERRIEREGLAGAVRLCGYVDDPEALADLYQRSDAVFVPSVAPEGSPRVIDEALLHGVPVVAAAQVVTPAMLATGAVVPCTVSVEGLLDAMSALVTPRGAALATAAFARAARGSEVSAAGQHAELFAAALSAR